LLLFSSPRLFPPRCHYLAFLSRYISVCFVL
jgi:hypothetical protein